MFVRRGRGLVVVIALALAACGGDGDEAVTTTTTSTSTATSSTTTTVATTTTTEARDLEAEVRAAFFAQWDAFFKLLSAPDPTDPLIEMHFASAAKERMLIQIGRFRERNAVAIREGADAFLAEIQRLELVNDTRAIVVECTIDRSLQVDAETGAVIDDSEIRAHFVNVFELLEGRWKLTSVRDAGEAEAPCDFS